MASNTSSKELSKAIAAFMAEPIIPIPDDLAKLIEAYLSRHVKYDETAADRLQEELLALFDKYVRGDYGAFGPWVAILRRLRPMIRTPERIVMWLDCLKGYLSQHADTGIITETIAAMMDLVALADEYQDAHPDGQDGVISNPIVDRLFQTWMERLYPAFVEGLPGMEYNERMFREALVDFGKRKPLQFFATLDSFFVQSKYRKAVLRFVCDFLQNRPPHVHRIIESDLFENLLTCLQEDTSTTVLSSALTALVMLLPYMPSSLVPHLPVLFNIYARLLFWNGADRPGASGSSPPPPTRGLGSEGSRGWHVSANEPGVDDDAAIPHLANYFTILYGLYPLNFMDYIRKPQRYLRHANVPNSDEFEIQPTELRCQSERFRRQHMLHPNFYTLTIETEKTDFGRWIKSEASEVVADCMALCLATDAVTINPQWEKAAATTEAGVTAPVTAEPLKEGPDPALLSSSAVVADTPLGRALSSSSLQTMTRHASHSSVNTNRESGSELRGREQSLTNLVGLVQSPSNSQLQDLIKSNKAIKSGRKQSSAAANESEASPSPGPHQDGPTPSPREDAPGGGATGAVVGTGGGSTATGAAFVTSPMALTGSDSSQAAHLQRQNLMLQNDLSFERYQKQQHIAHIGELRRKQVAEAATEAETQNLLIMTRNLKSRFEEAKEAEMRVRRESEKSRAMAKKWEADLSARLKTLRDQSKETKGELDRVRRELRDALDERDKLRRLVCAREVEELGREQDKQSAELRAAEVDRLQAEISRLTELDRLHQAAEKERVLATEAAAEAEGQMQHLRARLASHEMELQRARKLFEAQMRRQQQQQQQQQRQDQQRRHSTAAAPSQAESLEKVMAGSRARQAEMQQQYDMLMRKYTMLQSSLLDMQSGATPEQIKLESPSLPLTTTTSTPSVQPHPSSASTSRLPNKTVSGGNIRPLPPRWRDLAESGGGTATSYNVTPPLTEQQQQQLQQQGLMTRPSTSGGSGVGVTGSGSGSGSGTVKKEKKSTGLRGIRTGVEEFVRGKTE
ncbi:Hamartin protein [Geosmithia morbida]|uniref:Hamartin protein n=1 Tax=Geosmithia morbida TaxID=1094350 RepID=A0A9P4YS22_9HYPO|nr:Hamartin protein [Geosmithia morbida]KAF4121710.1 Hamartin protein [Geosmithia morbida]